MAHPPAYSASGGRDYLFSAHSAATHVFIVLEIKQAQLELTVYLSGGSGASTVNKNPLTGPASPIPRVGDAAEFSGVGVST